MFKKIGLSNIVVILAAVVLLASIQLSYADGNSFTINVPNNQGGYTSVVVQQSGSGFIGPQGEYYSQFPSVAQLQVMYGANASLATVTITVPPPALPVYVPPDPPDPSYIWTPGYWAYDHIFGDYYWVPGTWVSAPTSGYLWTPGYWGWRNGVYIFNDGYWGPHVGFYGGVNYGWGYGGRGFAGGSWNNGVFVNISFGGGHGGGWNNSNGGNGSSGASNSSFNGGPGGVHAQPTPEERIAMKEKHIPPTAAQKLQVRTARKNPALRASANHGKPPIAATAKAGVFKGKGVVAAKKAGAFYNKTKPKAASRGHKGGAQKNKAIAHAHAKAKPKAHPKPKPKPRPKPKPKVIPSKGDSTASQ